MNKWNDLPIDVLEIIFYYMREPYITMYNFYRLRFVSPTKDILQCQLTCKNWELRAQSNYYKWIYLNSLRQSAAFANTLRSNKDIGSLVKYIFFKYTFDNGNIQETIIPYLRQIAQFLPELKRIYCDFPTDSMILQTIKDERLKNRFLKLEILPNNFYLEGSYMKQYNIVANLYQQTLRELVIYDSDAELFGDLERLKHFENIDVLLFRLADCSNIYVAYKHIANCLTARSIYILNSEYENTGKLWKTKIDLHTPTFPQVEQIEVKDMLFDIKIYKYLMYLFPNVKSFSLDFFDDPYSSDGLPTDIALQYLHYLIKIPNVEVTYIPLLNLNDTMLRFFDSSNTINRLDIRYKLDSYQNESTSAGCSLYKRNKYIIIYISCTQIQLPVLPHIGLIENSGKNLRSLTIDMALSVYDMDLITKNPDNPDILSYLLQRCSSLKSIDIKSAFLYFKNFSEVEMKPISREFVRLYYSLIDPSFFSGLSYYAPYIAKFTIDKCEFIGAEQNNNNIFIDMPSTEFGSYNYTDVILVGQIFLKLTTTTNNKTVWYKSYENEYIMQDDADEYSIYEEESNDDSLKEEEVVVNNYTTCDEIDYTKSLKSKRSLSIAIRCKSVCTIEIEITGFAIIIKI